MSLKESIALNFYGEAMKRAEKAEDLLARAEAWIVSVPHSDNCFLPDGGPTTQCVCGKRALLEAISDVLPHTEGA